MPLTLRVALVCAAFLTGAVAAYPMHFGDPGRLTGIQSLEVFDRDLGFFVLTFVAWIGVLVATTFAADGRGWTQHAILLAFCFVFLILWLINTPGGRLWDESYQMAHLAYVRETGRLWPSHENLHYFNWPALHIVGSSLGLVADSGNDAVRLMTGTFLILSYAASALFAAGRLVGRGTSLALLTVLLILGLNPVTTKMSFYFPQAMGLALLVACVGLSTLTDVARTRLGVAGFVLFAALAITHFVSALMWLAILGCAVVWDTVPRRNAGASVRLVASLVILVAWTAYGATSAFPSLVHAAASVARDLSLDTFYYVSRSISNKVLVGDYWWAVLARFGFLAVVLLVVPLSWAWVMIRSGRRTAIPRIGVMGFPAIALTSLLLALASPGGNQLLRYQLYAPVIGVPLVVWLVLHYRGRAVVTAAIGVAVLVFTLPSFLTFNNSVEFDSTYPQQWVAARSMTGVVPSSWQVLALSDILAGPYLYQRPDDPFLLPASIDNSHRPTDYSNNLMQFINGARPGSIIIWARQLNALFESSFGNSPSEDPSWQEVQALLRSKTAVYDNGLIVHYARASSTEASAP